MDTKSNTGPTLVIVALLAFVPRLTPAFAQQIRQNIPYVENGHERQVVDVYSPDKARDLPVVFWIHGGGWQAGTKESGIPEVIPLARKGYFCATINYRLTGIAPFPAQIEDCKCAIRWVRAHAEEYNLDANHIGVWGGSAGGHLVALLGTSGGVKSTATSLISASWIIFNLILSSSMFYSVNCLIPPNSAIVNGLV
jgi:acetyl esterase/lipase